MPSLNFYNTTNQATEELRKRGFTELFVPTTGGLRAVDQGKNYPPKKLLIIEYHRFERSTVDGETSVIFAIKTIDGHRGIFTFQYGGRADMQMIEMMNKIPVQWSEIQD